MTQPETESVNPAMTEGAAWLSMLSALKLIQGRPDLLTALTSVLVRVAHNQAKADSSEVHDRFVEAWREYGR